MAEKQSGNPVPYDVNTLTDDGQSANTLTDIRVTGNITSTIVKRLEMGLSKQMTGETLRKFLADNWNMEKFTHPEPHRDKRFFETLRNTLRDHGVACHNNNMARSLPIGQKILHYIWSELPEAT